MTSSIRRLCRATLALVALYLAWLIMMLIHELGHALNGALSGASGISILIPAVGFSRTEFKHNPHPHFVAWGGVVWGSLLPTGVIALQRILPRLTRAPFGRRAVLFFAGFCLICNGAYLGAGGVAAVGDAGDLLQLGTPLWIMVALGTAAMIAGLYLWHLLTSWNSDPTPNR